MTKDRKYFNLLDDAPHAASIILSSLINHYPQKS